MTEIMTSAWLIHVLMGERVTIMKDHIPAFVHLDGQDQTVKWVSLVFKYHIYLTLLHSEWPKFLRVLAILSAIGLRFISTVSGILYFAIYLFSDN